ncbi:hypothetical protein Fmac_020295 [Flemingia macrophylla]|uniref:MATH domain-containing protein n=1 Tax=Flemingia macrophylla TaxID=520843 RepID=A0ABD1LU91_9FABA
MENQNTRDKIFEKFTWKIRDFSKLGSKNLYSDKFSLDDHTWRIFIKPKGKTGKGMSIFLDVGADLANLPDAWNKFEKFKLVVVNQVDDKKTKIKASSRAPQESSSAAAMQCGHPAPPTVLSSRSPHDKDKSPYEASPLSPPFLRSTPTPLHPPHEWQIQQAWPQRHRVALSDCVNQIFDSVTELSKVLNELQHLRARTFEWQMSNTQTWTSASLTNDNAYLDSLNLAVAVLKLEVKRRVTDLGMLTSNALYMITHLGDTGRN